MTTIVQRSVTVVYPLHGLTFQPRAAPVPVSRDRRVLPAHLRVGLAIGSFHGFLPVSRVLFCSDYGRRNENRPYSSSAPGCFSLARPGASSTHRDYQRWEAFLPATICILPVADQSRHTHVCPEPNIHCVRAALLSSFPSPPCQ